MVIHTKQLAEQLELAHRKIVIERNYRLPNVRVMAKHHAIPLGVMAFTIENLFAGTLPDRVVVGLIRDTDFAGSYQTNPFHFRNVRCTSMIMKRNGVAVPREGYETDFETGDIEEAYQIFQEELGYGYGDKNACITEDMWKKGFTLWVFKITDGPIGSGDVTPRSKPINGTLRLEMKFAKALSNNMKAIIISESAGLYEIDQYNNFMVL
jgi:hypothetical protein